jgi:hypothetical protein
VIGGVRHPFSADDAFFAGTGIEHRREHFPAGFRRGSCSGGSPGGELQARLDAKPYHTVARFRTAWPGYYATFFARVIS